MTELRAPAPPIVIDESLAEAVGMDDLASLKTAIREQLERDYAGVARSRLKRQLLDQLADTTDFEVPQGMVDMEFDSIWQQLEQEKERAKARLPAPAEGQSGRRGRGERGARGRSDVERWRYGDGTGRSSRPTSHRSLPEVVGSEGRLSEDRRASGAARICCCPRLGGRTTLPSHPRSLTARLTEEARRHPGYEKQVMEYYRNHPEALSNLQAPIYEDKVVDFIVELAKVAERSVKPAELMAPLPGDEDEETSGEQAA